MKKQYELHFNYSLTKYNAIQSVHQYFYHVVSQKLDKYFFLFYEVDYKA